MRRACACLLLLVASAACADIIGWVGVPLEGAAAPAASSGGGRRAGTVFGLGLGLTLRTSAPGGVGVGVDNLLLESGDNLLLEDGASVLLLE